MKLKPIAEYSTGHYMRFPALYICRCPKCHMILKRSDEKCRYCETEIDWSDCE